MPEAPPGLKMSEASPKPLPSVEAQQPSLSELAGQAWRTTQDALRTDQGIQTLGIGVGAAAGLTIAVALEGMPVHPTAAQQRAELHSHQQKDGAPAMVEANTLQKGTIGGSTVLGLTAAVLYTRFRRRHG